MKLTFIGHDDRYAIEQLQMSLFPAYIHAEEGHAVSKLSRGQKWLTATTTIELNGKRSSATKRILAAEESVRLRRRALQQSYYLAALPHLEQAPSWGALAGVRPTKLSTKHILEGGTPRSADKMLRDIYFVEPARRKLAIDCSLSTVRAVNLLNDNDVSLYVGIPFCPTRCAYCSFVSRTVGKRTELMTPYLEALAKELSVTGELLKKSGKTIRSVYMGGGTPTTLTAEQMAWLLDTIYASFDLSRCLEFTVEGGRPDTLDAEKLRTIREHGADRMSINPQTMEDPVLKACGRPHKAADVLRAYQEAVDAGFTAINMDLIAGLPQDSYEGFCRSLDTVIALNPANITVHTLALKKGADLFEKKVQLPSQEEVAKMVEYANAQLEAHGYKPYYLYRQKYMTGSFENVGWSRNGTDNLYNIYMMEELHSILSLGSGGITKIVEGNKLERLANPKYPQEYIRNIDDIAKKKREVCL